MNKKVWSPCCFFKVNRNKEGDHQLHILGSNNLDSAKDVREGAMTSIV